MREIARLLKQERQEELRRVLLENPFYTDDELARRFSVSIQTIRLDRMELGIPELRERLKQVAERRFDPLRSLLEEEVIGEIVDLTLDQSAISILTITEEHVFSRTGIARGHILFAQANSLAVALTNAEVALTAQANIRFLRPVHLGERVIAKAKVVKEGKREYLSVRVDGYVNEEMVMTGEFLVYRRQEKAQEREEKK
ncbi:transcription factor controlling fatty acid and phospholipid metabolism [[Clostridium] ultunense Esp]|nr:transcription factor controlling fatty acid and phospholipid metabolism [[Clostridium] ultunense Esp]